MALDAVEEDVVKSLRRRQDAILGRLHAITKSRDAGEATFQETLGIESLLVMELGQIQDRLSMLGEHAYDGCAECRPETGGRAAPVRAYRMENWRSYEE